MAPSRRKGKATTAAATVQLKWKVGDLVLAKMKGFPPWPAVISDPQKWGYSSDRRKLFVYFFGTKQIAFCNHSDVEVFTEEKKRSLLGKKHGKGVDFSRAVDEIIENFENLTKRKVSDELCPRDYMESQFESTEDSLVNDTEELKKESLIITSEGDPSEALVPPQINDSHNSEIIPKGFLENDVSKRKVMCTKSSDVSNSCQVQKESDKEQKLTSNSRVKKKKYQMSEASVADNNSDRYLRSDDSIDDCSKPKSVDAHETSSETSTLVRNCINDDIVLYSSNERDGIELESPSKGPCLNGGLEAQGKTFARKKRRKPSKNHYDEEVKASRNPGKEGSEKSGYWGHQNDHLFNLTSGDEHLPLLKRARVRMGNIPTEKNVKESEEEMLAVVHDFSPSSDDCCRSGHVISRQSEERMCVSSCSAIEMEAALPPSKRLHRALEAMSANEAEANNGFLGAPNLITVPSTASAHVDVGQEVSYNVKNITSPLESMLSPNLISVKNQIDERDCDKPSPNRNTSDQISPRNLLVKHTSVFLKETAACLQSVDESPLMVDNEMYSGDKSNKDENTSKKTMMVVEAAAAQKYFNRLVSTLSSTKENISRATRVAIACMRHGIPDKVVQILLQNLESTENFDKKLLLFSLVDSIAKHSPVQKDVAGGSYAALFGSVLARLLLAAAPPESNGSNNCIQCLKVLKSWHERRILQDSVLRLHIQQLNDRITEREAMVVDDNAGSRSPVISGSHSMDDEDHDFKITSEVEQTPGSSLPDKHTHILESVDDELEMENVSPQILSNEPAELSTSQQAFTPPLPEDNPPSPPLLPSSPPPSRNNLQSRRASYLSGGSSQKQLPSPPCHYQSSYFYSKGCAWKPNHNETADKFRFSSTTHSGPILTDKTEGSPNFLISSAGSSWSNPPRASGYGFPVGASRPPFENTVSRVAGAPGYWRPR
ncbi:protein HUA2-LIKE 2-like isoform X3 [Wolffia australiana]